MKHHDFNHPLAQVDAYLSDEVIQTVLHQENDCWQRISMANIYYLRAHINRHALRIERAVKDEILAHSLLPTPQMYAVLQATQAHTPVSWF